MKKNQNGFSVVEVLVVLIIVGLLGVVGWLVYDRQKASTSKQPKTTQVEETKKESETPKYTIPENYTEYKNTTLSFSFGYPNNWGNVTGEEKPNTGSKGSIFYGTFSANDKVKLIYNSADYDAFPGGGCALSRRVIVKQIDEKAPAKDSKIIKSDSGVDIQLREGTYYTDDDDGGCPIDGYYDEGTFNTKNSTYPAVQLRQEYTSARDTETQEQFVEVLKTIRLL